MTDYKEHGKTFSITVIASWLPLIGAFWFLGKPLLISAVSEAVASDIKIQVTKGLEPINNAFAALMRNNISAIRKDIALLEFKRDNTDVWTQDDAKRLVQLKIDLDAAKEALAALEADVT